MENLNDVYTKQEKKILSEIKGINDLIFTKYLFLLFLILCFYISLKDFINLIRCIQNNNFGFLSYFIMFCIIDLVLFIIMIYKFNFYKKLIIKYNKVNDPNQNPLAIFCVEQISECKKLIASNESFYTVQSKYMEIKDFLKRNKDVLPITTYEDSQKELKIIESQMIHCKAKR